MRVVAAHSERVGAVVERAARGDTGAVEALWAQARKRGGPLVERNGADGLLTTFLWRGEAERVVMIGPSDNDDLRRTELTRVDGTDIWYLSVLLPPGLRASYVFSVNERFDAILDGPTWIESLRHWHPDPLNPYRYHYADNDDGIEPSPTAHRRSALYLPPGAGPSPWSTPRPGVPAGDVTMHWFRAGDGILAKDHRVWVYTPSGMAGRRGPLPVAVLMDGDCYVGPMVGTPTILDNLIAAGAIPPTVAVLVASLDDRTVELNGDPTFLRFLTDELMPWVSARWPVTVDPAATLVGGSSLGGTTAAYAALTAPGRFGLVLSQSGAFQFPPPDAFPGGVAARLAAATRLPTRWWMNAGQLETELLDGFEGSLLEANRRLRDLLVARGCPVRYGEFVGGHDYLCWRDTLPDGLIHLLG